MNTRNRTGVVSASCPSCTDDDGRGHRPQADLQLGPLGQRHLLEGHLGRAVHVHGVAGLAVEAAPGHNRRGSGNEFCRLSSLMERISTGSLPTPSVRMVNCRSGPRPFGKAVSCYLQRPEAFVVRNGDAHLPRPWTISGRSALPKGWWISMATLPTLSHSTENPLMVKTKPVPKASVLWSTLKSRVWHIAAEWAQRDQCFAAVRRWLSNCTVFPHRSAAR